VDDCDKERPSGLTRKIKKLRRNWSLRKEDISKGISKIKKSSKTLIEDVYWKEARFTTVGSRRKISLSQLLSTDQPELRGEPATVSTFYVSGPRPVSSPGPEPCPGPVVPSRRRSSGRPGRAGPVQRPAEAPPAPPLPALPPPGGGEGIYTSSLFHSEPLYQFYQERERPTSPEELEELGLLEEIESDPIYRATQVCR
jgi:hypothetical protein